ncbi:hypothetical protein ACHAWF_014078, partial [Thalassiosira exigua]
DLLYPCLSRIEDDSQSDSDEPSPVVLENDTIRLAGACFVAISISSLGLMIPLLPCCQYEKNGIGLINLKSSEDTHIYDGNYHCSSLKDQTILWMGVAVACLTSFGILATFWPESRVDKYCDEQTSSEHQTRQRRCCCRKNRRASPEISFENMEPLVSNDDIEEGQPDPSREDDSNAGNHNIPSTNTVTPAKEERDLEMPSSDMTTSRLRGTSRLLKLAGNESLYIWVDIAVLLMRLPFSLAIPHFVSTTIGELIDSDYNGAQRGVLLLFLLGTVDSFLYFWCIFLFGKANENIVKALQVDTFYSILRQEQAFFDRTSTGDLVSRLTSDCGEMAGFRFDLVLPCGSHGKDYGAVQTALAASTSSAHESIACIKTVIKLASEDHECKKYNTEIEKLYDLRIRQQIATGVYFMAVIAFLINTCVQASLLLLGSIFVEQGKLTPEILLAFMLYQGQLQLWTKKLFDSYSSLIKSSGAGDRIFSLLDRMPPPPGTGNLSVKSYQTETSEVETDKDIIIDNVSFSYPTRPGKLALDQINLHIKSGSLVALVGHSGCGKSTVVSLLGRLYDPDDGIIKFGSLDLRMMNLSKHRSMIGFVTQDNYLFSGTIEENIGYGTPVTSEEITMVSRIANADCFIQSFPNKYKEQVGERGQSLSGGQRQRIAIARALIRKPALLLLDEATSALDPESEAAVQEAMNELLQNRFGMTTIIIAHRLQTVRSADTIFVMKNGMVVEQGAHDELLQNERGHYRRMLDRADSSDNLPDAS